MSVVADFIYQKFKRAIASLGFIVRTSATSVLASDPTISSGSGAPSAAEPNGSIYLRTNGAVTTSLYVRVSAAWVAVPCTDAELSALAGLTSAADKIPYFTGVGTASTADFTAAARTLVAAANTVAQRAALGLVIGTDVQAYDAGLASHAGLPTVADRIAYSTALNVWAEWPISAAGRALIDDADAAAQATTLGLGVGDSPTWTGGTFSGNVTIGGILKLTGGAVLVDVEHVDMRANYQYQNSDYATAVAVTGGRVINYLPTATQTNTSGAGVFTAGVDAVSDPTVTTAGSATFAATDIVQISGSTSNDGLYEVQGHIGTTLTLKSTASGITNRVEAWTLDQVTAGTDTGATITKVTVAVDRVGTDGRFEAGSGSQTGFSYSDYVLASDIGTSVQAYNAGLASHAAFPTVADRFVYSTAEDVWAEAPITAAARSILDDASVADICETLGLGVTDSPTFAAITAAGGGNFTGGTVSCDNFSAGGDATVAGNILNNNLVKATCTGGDAGGGGTTVSLTVQLNKMDGSSAISAARQVMLWGGATAGSATAPVPNASLSLGTVTAGSIVSGAEGIWLIETNNAGLFACTATNTDDETVYWSALTPPGGVADLAKAALVIGSNSDASAWSA